MSHASEISAGFSEVGRLIKAANGRLVPASGTTGHPLVKTAGGYAFDKLDLSAINAPSGSEGFVLKVAGGAIVAVAATGAKAAFYQTATATGSPQSITIPAGYIASDLLVFEDGVLQLAGTHYTVNGTTLTGTFYNGAQLVITSPGGAQGAKGETGAAGNMSGSNNLSEITDPVAARANLQVTAASASDYRNANANASSGTRFLTPDTVFGAAQTVSLTDAATITPDLNTFINAVITLSGDRTIANPANLKVGQTGFITLIQDGTGSRKVNWGDYFFFAGGLAPTLSTAPGAIDRLYYTVTSSTSIDCSVATNMMRSYDSDAQAYFNAHTVQAPAARKNLIHSLVTGLKSDGVWPLLDNLWLLASHDEQSSLVNVVRPSKSLSKYSSPFFTNSGWYSSSSIGSSAVGYLFTPEPYWGTGFKRTSAQAGSFGVWTNTTTVDNNNYFLCGQGDNNLYEYITQTSSSNLSGKSGGGTVINGSYTAAKGMKAVLKVSNDGNAGLYRDTTLLGFASGGSSLSTSSPFTILGAGAQGSYYSTFNRISFAFTAGDGMSFARYQSLYNRVNTYLTAIGAQ